MRVSRARTSRPARVPPAACALADGFSLHAATHVRAADREGLEYLCRYGARGPLSLERLSRLPDGRLRYTLRRPWPTDQGVTSLTFEPVHFLRRLALLIPPPYQHLVRYHGFFAPNSRWSPRGVSQHRARSIITELRRRSGVSLELSLRGATCARLLPGRSVAPDFFFG